MRKSGKLIITVLAAAMTFQMTAMAAPIDELNEILTNQTALQQDTLLSQTLGLTEMKEMMQQNGIDVQWRGGFADGTVEALGLQEDIPAGAYAELGFQLDLNAENWLVEAGFGTEEGALGNLALYGDHDKLSLSIPQLFVGALSLHAGNLKEQYAGSAITSLMGEDYSAYIPDLNTRFYPEEGDLDLVKGFVSSFEEAMLQQVQDIQSEVRVEKKGNSEEMVYTMTLPTEVIKDVYGSFFDSYLSVIGQLGIVDVSELYDAEEQLDLMLDAMFTVMPEDIEVDFYTKDNLLEKMSYELYLDTAAMEAQLEQMDGEISYNTQSSDEVETILTEVVEGFLDEAGTVSDIYVEETAEGFKGTASYEIIYKDPSNPAGGMDIHMNMTDEEQGEFADFLIQMATVVEGTVSTTTVSMDITAMGENAYSGTIYTQTFDAATGDLDMTIAFESDPESLFAVEMDEEMPVIALDSTFSEIEPGIGFTWVMDGLSMEVEGQSIGITSEVTVNAQPEAITAPQQERVLLDMTEDELMSFLMEVMMNAQSWAAQFEPETEDGAYDMDVIGGYDMEDDEVYEETVIGAEADAVTVIGGADGPTSIFLAGKVS